MMLRQLESLVGAGRLAPLHLHFARLMARLDPQGDDGLHLAAALVSHYTMGGHTCLPLAAAAEAAPLAEEGAPALPPLEDWLASLRRSPVVGDGQRERTPLVLDPAGRLYLYRYWDYERRLAEQLRARAGLWEVPRPERVRQALAPLFDDEPRVDWQRLAAATALARRLTVISGGPGTGKTTTVVRILAALLSLQPQLRIGLAAPTGKAAARLHESIRQAKARLPVDEALRAAIPEQAATVHRLLGVIPDSPYFRHGVDNPLHLDCLVLDEASMVDLALMSKLLEALPPQARLIILGDKDQLASVEAGAVLGEICAGKSANGFSSAFADWLGQCGRAELDRYSRPGAGFGDGLVLLEHSHRFGADSGIGRLARAINAGDAQAASAELQRDGEVGWHGGGAPDWLEPAAAQLADWFRAWRDQPPEQALEAFARLRLLCAHRGGRHGVDEVNQRVEGLLRERGLIRAAGAWYPGRPVMIARNDYRLQLFNGDIGITLPDEEGRLRVNFLTADGQLRRLLLSRLPEHETCYAMTVHKSQGSEFQQVLLLLPERPSPVLTRELVYTAVTRARERFALWGPEEALRRAVATPVRRSSGLAARLWE